MRASFGAAIGVLVFAGCIDSDLGATPGVGSEQANETIEFEMVFVGAACSELAEGCSTFTGGGTTGRFYAVGNETLLNVSFRAVWDAAQPFEEELLFRIAYVDETPDVEFSGRSPVANVFAAPPGIDFTIVVRPAADPSTVADLRIDATLEGPVRGPKPP